MRKCIPLIVVILAGCSWVRPGKNSDPVEITGQVTQGGKVVTDVTLTLLATKGGMQATLPVKDGTVKGSVVPGRYTYFISEGKNPAVFEAIPEQYRTGSLDRQIDIDSGSALTITLD